ncbi:MAG: FdtA/QdtA family cupin domain-containing protein [Bacilli bacterium]|nr:FdtA/QdtA family cupin domain-containing protein [Bacilli bacterium]
MRKDITKYNVHTDKWGKLVALEGNGEIPFNIKRVYYIYGVKEGVRRGFHSHKKLEQILICVHGSVKILLKTPDDEEIVTLNKQNEGLYIGPNVWREMYDFEDNAVLLVLASNHFKESDYIRNYDDYVKYYEKYVREKKQ